MIGFRQMALSAVLAVFVSTAARAAITIDDFTVATPTITQTGAGNSTSTGVSGAGILGTRTIAVTVASPLTSATASVGSGLAEASFNGDYSPVNLANNFTVSEAFGSTNATGSGLNDLEFIVGSSLGTTMTITANGTSTYAFTDPSNPGGTSHDILFSSFSNPAVFSNLTSLTFTETFPNQGISGPSVAFSGPIILTTAVPEPGSMLLCVTLGTFILGCRPRIARRSI